MRPLAFATARPVSRPKARAAHGVVINAYGDVIPDSADDAGSLLNEARRWLTIALLAIGMALGGAHFPELTIVIEMVGIALLFCTLVIPGAWPTQAKWAIGLTLTIGLIPFVQMLPIPFDLWRTLPGHASVADIQVTAGAADGYHALTLSPEMTLETGLALIPGVALFLSVLRAGTAERRALIWVAATIAIVSALIGVVQMSTGMAQLYETPHAGSSVGIFVNRNHHADLIMAAMFLSAAAIRLRWRGRSMRYFGIGFVLMLALCVISTTSRMGVAIMPLAVLGSVAMLLKDRSETSPRRAIRWIGLAVVVGALAIPVLLPSQIGQHVIERFATARSDGRLSYWGDVIVAIKTYFPLGSGLGTFVPVYASVENLDLVYQHYVNHAHNDYLEIVLETGLAGVVLLLSYAAIVLRAAAKIRGSRDAVQRVAGLGIVTILLLHSTVDYPLRTFTLMLIFALGNALLLGAPDRHVNASA